jgi:glycine oxidase
MVHEFDVAVAGAGIIGSAIAYECASRGLRVVLLDRDEPGAHASGAAAGMLAPCSEAHQAGPFLDLAREGLAQWPELALRVREDSGSDPELMLDGLLRVAVDEAAAAEVQTRLRWQNGAGIDEGRWVDIAAARELEPALSGDIAGAAWYPHEGHVHSRSAVRALVDAAQRRGAAVVTNAEVVGPAVGAPGVRLRTGEEIHATRVVLSSGAWLGELATAFGSALPVRPVYGQLAVLRGVPAPPRRVVFAGLHGYVVAKRDGTVLAGATEEDRGFDTAPRPEVTATLHARAARLVAGAAEATTVHAWTGLRPCAPDRLPLLGPLPGRDDGSVLVAGGHHRNGVLLAPVTARGIAAMLVDGVAPHGWEAFDPRRFG